MQHCGRLLSIAYLLLIFSVALSHPTRLLLYPSRKSNNRQLKVAEAAAFETEDASASSSIRQEANPTFGDSQVRWAADMDDVTPPTPFQELTDASISPAEPASDSSTTEFTYTAPDAAYQEWESDSEPAAADSTTTQQPNSITGGTSSWDYGDDYATAALSASTTELTDASLSPLDTAGAAELEASVPSGAKSDIGLPNLAASNDQPAGATATELQKPDSSVPASSPISGASNADKTTDFASGSDLASAPIDSVHPVADPQEAEVESLTGPGADESMPESTYSAGGSLGQIEPVPPGPPAEPDWALDLEQPDAAAAAAAAATAGDNGNGTLPEPLNSTAPDGSRPSSTPAVETDLRESGYAGAHSSPAPAGLLRLPGVLIPSDQGADFAKFFDMYGDAGAVSQYVFYYPAADGGNQTGVEDDVLLIDESEWHVWVDAATELSASLFNRAPFKATTLADVYLGGVESASSRAQASSTAMILVSIMLAAALSQ